jgi:hypothetical protein
MFQEEMMQENRPEKTIHKEPAHTIRLGEGSLTAAAVSYAVLGSQNRQ